MKTRDIMSCGILFFILALLFPPFETATGKSCGYGFLFIGKKIKYITCHEIDVSFLLIEFLLIGLVVAFIYLRMKNE